MRKQPMSHILRLTQQVLQFTILHLPHWLQSNDMSRSGWLICPIVICLLGGVAAGQKDPAKDTAVRQMRRIVNAIKQCPEVASPLMLSENFATRHEGPPSIVDWDVVASDSFRSPLQGFVKFNVPIRTEETEEAKQSAKLDKKYRDFVELLRIYEKGNNHSASVVEYRYEFDVGSDAPELRRAWIFAAPSKSFMVYEPRQGSCSDRIASSPESAGSSPATSQSPNQPPISKPLTK